jgi:membrane protein implicated in regulation of membrane protease activity
LYILVLSRVDMDTYLIWLVAGFLLVIVELVSGTFYLLVLGVAAVAGGVVAYTGLPFSVQAVVAATLAVVGVVWVNRVRRTSSAVTMRSLDFGQPTTFDHWVNRPGQARVKYRDALWDATVDGEIAGEPGEILYVASIDGNTLKVSQTRQA